MCFCSGDNDYKMEKRYFLFRIRKLEHKFVRTGQVRDVMVARCAAHCAN